MRDESRPAIAGWDPVWEEIFKRRDWGKYPSEHVVRFVLRRFGSVEDRSGIRILDLGCAAGAACAWFAAREGFRVSAIDGSSAAIGKARARLESDGLSVELRTADVVTLPWEEGTFDAVVDNACVCHNTMANSRRILAEVHRVLKPSGWLHSASFSTKCSDYGRGTEMEPGGLTTRTGDGPLSGDYFVRFSTRAQIEDLYRPFQSVVIDSESHSVDGAAHLVDLWIVTAQKSDDRSPL